MTARSRPVALRELPGRYFVRAAVPTVVVTAAAATVALVQGPAEALAVALGGAVVLVFFGIDLLAMRVSSGWDPAATFLLVMVEYLGKIIGLALLLAALRGQDEIPSRAVGVGVGVAATVFLGALVVAHLRIPTFVVEPDDSEPPHAA